MTESTSVLYSKKPNKVFEVTIDDKKYIFFKDDWNRFLDKHGTNSIPEKGNKRISGTDAVDSEALTQFIKQDLRYGF